MIAEVALPNCNIMKKRSHDVSIFQIDSSKEIKLSARCRAVCFKVRDFMVTHCQFKVVLHSTTTAAHHVSCSALERALVKLLLAIAREFSIILSINRDSSDAQIKTAYKKVLVRVHPDKPGGSTERTKELTGLWGQWQDSQRVRGRPT